MPKAHAEDKGLGLRTMRYRAGMIGASIEISPAPRGGTIVTCWLPTGGSQEPGKMPARLPGPAAKRT
jgi:signal transduction histidine kinase